MASPELPPEGVCPVCSGTRLLPLLRATGVPVHQNFFATTRAVALSVTRATLDYVRCAACGLTYNQAFDPSLLRYDSAYEVDQSCSPRFLEHLDEVCDRAASRVSGEIDVVEIGCGQGSFLARLAERLGPRLRSAVGFDPAFRGEVRLPPRVRVVARPFDAVELPRSERSPDLVVLRHTIEHVPDPVEFLTRVHASFRDAPFDLLVETPDADYPVRHRIVHDFYYEHCALHAAESLVQATTRAGFSHVAIDRVFGEEYLLAFGAAGGERAPAPAPLNVARASDVATFVEACAAFVPRFRDKLDRARARSGGRIAIWGAAGKGVTLALLLDPARELIDAVVDIDPAKEGKFVPGTGHPIVGPERARALGVRIVVAANDRYLAEIEARCRASGWDAEVWRASP